MRVHQIYKFLLFIYFIIILYQKSLNVKFDKRFQWSVYIILFVCHCKQPVITVWFHDHGLKNEKSDSKIYFNWKWMLNNKH